MTTTRQKPCLLETENKNGTQYQLTKSFMHLTAPAMSYLLVCYGVQRMRSCLSQCCFGHFRAACQP
jgi:hypothetical protein